jgi:hypothetical protein
MFVLNRNIDFVLQHDNVLKLHDINSDQMLSRLGLGVNLVTSDEEQGGVHDSRARQHGSHEGIVTGAINE